MINLKAPSPIEREEAERTVTERPFHPGPRIP